MTIAFNSAIKVFYHTTINNYITTLTVAITSHYVDDNFTIIEDILDFRHIPECHTSTNYIDSKRDKPVKDPLQWWSKSQSIFPKLSKTARDMYAAPATGAGVEREFSISGRVITKQRNWLNPSTIRDVMQYKRWVTRHGIIADPMESLETDETEDQNQEVLLEDDENINSELVEWLKAWEKKEKLSQRVKRLVVM